MNQSKISQYVLEKILGIKEKTNLSINSMSKDFSISFVPTEDGTDKDLQAFSIKLKSSLRKSGVNVVEFDDIWEKVSITKRIKRLVKYSANNVIWIIRKILGLQEINFLLSFKTIGQLCSPKKIKKGICVFCVGEQKVKDLVMNHITNFKTNSIITIIKFPQNIDQSSSFIDHFNASMSLFAYHMSNIIIAVNDEKWMVYNFNAAHPIFDINSKDFDTDVQNSLIPKLAAPIKPLIFDDFVIQENKFDPHDSVHGRVIDEMKKGAALFDKTGLYPIGKKIDELPFRDNLHKHVGKLHLDNRNGMSFGYIAYQMPTVLYAAIPLEDFTKKHPGSFLNEDFFVENGVIYISLEILSKKVVIRIPDVWVMTLRSGSNKTNFNSETDLIKLGLINGKMMMSLPKKIRINTNYRPSFDSRVIVAHALGNSILASIILYLNEDNKYTNAIKNKGLAIVHWHGYWNNSKIPSGMILHGGNNLHVSCSSPQSAIYAIDGKLNGFIDKIDQKFIYEYSGDIHIEPHHGINVSYIGLIDLAQHVIENRDVTSLGNKYL